ncbi:unnamed protein product [Gadus morhua 'NCC']
MYSEMSDTQLDALVLEIHRIHLCGYRMLRYHLQGRGHLVQIHRVRQSLKRVDPEGTEQRALANPTLHRRQYSVPGPNCMWHIDGNHKLIRWRFVIHGGIDGFSRLVVFLSAATNNRATTVLDAFLGAFRQYGVPSRVRADKGRENFEVAYYMVDNCGPNRNSHITGRSVHDQSLRTENSQSPYQLWLRNISAVADPPEVDDLYGASVDGPDPEDLAGVDVPEIQLPLDEVEAAEVWAAEVEAEDWAAEVEAEDWAAEVEAEDRAAEVEAEDWAAESMGMKHFDLVVPLDLRSWYPPQSLRAG